MEQPKEFLCQLTVFASGVYTNIKEEMTCTPEQAAKRCEEILHGLRKTFLKKNSMKIFHVEVVNCDASKIAWHYEDKTLRAFFSDPENLQSFLNI